MKINRKNEKGQVLIIIVFGVVMLFALTALAVDGNNVFSDRRNAQNAADTAVLAAARAYVRGEDWGNAGYTLASDNGYVHDEVKTWVSVENPPSDGPYKDNADYIEVSITHIVDMYFAQIIGVNSLTNTVRAVAHVKPSVYSPLFNGNAVVALNKTSCKALEWQGNSAITITGSGLFSNSSCDGQSFFNNSGAGLMTAPALCSVGEGVYKPGSTDVDSISNGGCEQFDPSAAYTKPNINCDGLGTASKSDDSHYSSPGYIYGDLSVGSNKTLNLASGTYCITGDMDIKGTLTGTNVLLYVQGDTIKVDAQANVSLTGPTSGDYNGLLLYADSSTVTINGGGGLALTGTMLMPNADVSIEGGAGTGINGQVIGDTVKLTGGSETNINYNAGQNWNPPSSPVIDLVE